QRRGVLELELELELGADRERLLGADEDSTAAHVHRIPLDELIQVRALELDLQGDRGSHVSPAVFRHWVLTVRSGVILAGKSRGMQSGRSLSVLVFFAAWLAGLIALAAYPRPLSSLRGRGMVAADHPESSRAGAQVLARGGNAVDAAVATALAAGVVSPAGSGLGGGGFLLYWSAKERHAYVLDFRETAPKAARADMFVVDGKADPKRSQLGGAAVAVPGEPAGLAYAAAKWGKLGLAADDEAAIKLAKEGFRASRALAASAREKFVPLPPSSDPMRALIAPLSSLIVEGDRMDNPALALT